MTDPCPACQGRKLIRLPLYYPASVMAGLDAVPSTPQEGWREYDCPECVKKVKYERLGYSKARKLFDVNRRMLPRDMANWREATIKHAALSMVDHLLRDGFIKVDEIPPDDYHPGAIQVTMNVVHPTAAQPLEERVAERQMEVADEVAMEAVRLIDNWGSYYRATSISKGDAHREISAAVANVRAKRGKR